MGNKGSLSFIALLFVVIIICMMAFQLLNTYLKHPLLDQSTSQTMAEQGISTNSSQSILDSVKTKVGEINNQLQGQEATMNDGK